MSSEIKRWIRCKIKNIAALNTSKMTEVEVRFKYLELQNTLPDNCIRLHSSIGWCYNSCEGAVCRECEHEC